MSRVNRTTTVCFDGSSQSACYIASIDFGALGLSDNEAATFTEALASGHGLVRATLERKSIGSLGDFGVLRVSEAWRAGSDQAPSGSYYRLTDSQIRCLAPPCASINEAKLNSTFNQLLVYVDFSNTGASLPAIVAANEELFRSGLLAAGSNELYYGDHQLVAAQFYTRVTHQPGIEGAPCGASMSACTAGLFCDVAADNQCGVCNAEGVCRAVPQACYQLYAPVCGCDGKTYGNECERLGARMQRAHHGPCENPT